MTNQDRAAQVIEASYETGFDTPRDIAKYLDESGLLAPDLPSLSSDYATIEVPTRRTLIMDDAAWTTPIVPPSMRTRTAFW